MNKFSVTALVLALVFMLFSLSVEAGTPELLSKNGKILKELTSIEAFESYKATLKEDKIALNLEGATAVEIEGIIVAVVPLAQDNLPNKISERTLLGVYIEKDSGKTIVGALSVTPVGKDYIADIATPEGDTISEHIAEIGRLKKALDASIALLYSDGSIEVSWKRIKVSISGEPLMRARGETGDM